MLETVDLPMWLSGIKKALATGLSTPIWWRTCVRSGRVAGSISQMISKVFGTVRWYFRSGVGCPLRTLPGWGATSGTTGAVSTWHRFRWSDGTGARPFGRRPDQMPQLSDAPPALADSSGGVASRLPIWALARRGFSPRPPYRAHRTSDPPGLTAWPRQRG